MRPWNIRPGLATLLQDRARIPASSRTDQRIEMKLMPEIALGMTAADQLKLRQCRREAVG